MKINVQDAIFDNKALAMLTGNDLVEGAKNVTRIETVTVNSNAAAISKTPVGDPIGVYVLNADGTLGEELTLAAGTVATGEYDITGKNLTFFAGDLADGTKVSVYFSVSTDATAKNLKVTSDQFGKSFKVVIDTVIVDEYTKDLYAGQIIIPNAKFEDNFNLS